MRFGRAIAAAPWTLPSFTSILTSLYPSRHGAGRGGRGRYTRVHPDALLLSEVLYGRGYLTAGLVANPFVSPRFGLDQGYVTYTSRFADPGYEGQFRDYVDFEYLVERPGRRRFAHEGPPPVPPMNEADARRITDLYDAEIAETDAEVGRVLDALKDLGLWESTVVVFTSDHFPAADWLRTEDVKREPRPVAMAS